MSLSKPIAALAAGCLLMSAAALAQTGGGPPVRRGGHPGHRSARAGADRLDRTVGRGRLARGCHRKDGASDRHAGQEGRRRSAPCTSEMAELTVDQEQAAGRGRRPQEKAEAQILRRRVEGGAQQAAQRAEAWHGFRRRGRGARRRAQGRRRGPQRGHRKSGHRQGRARPGRARPSRSTRSSLRLTASSSSG